MLRASSGIGYGDARRGMMPQTSQPKFYHRQRGGVRYLEASLRVFSLLAERDSANNEKTLGRAAFGLFAFFGRCYNPTACAREQSRWYAQEVNDPDARQVEKVV